ncbi:MAG TPA: hypothetical protein PKD18_05630 [Saprospiraceae bacterium]|nr:hypothetical protein [Saprospiraceae bacterium]
MEKICVTFEEWYIGDGTYPPLTKGQNVNLALYIQPYEKTFTTNSSFLLKQLKNSDYEFSGEIIHDFQDSDNRLIVIDTKKLLFYIEIPDTETKSLEGQFVLGKGQLLIDYYIWAEYFCNYENAPDLFYNFNVDKIRKVKIPEKFIHRHGSGFSAPTSLATNNYNENDTEEIEDMNDKKSDISFFLLDLTPITDEIEKTFI